MGPKLIGLVILLVFLVIFAIQNPQPVAVKFLFWEITTSAVISILVSFVVGFLVGWLISLFRRQDKKPKTPSL